MFIYQTKDGKLNFVFGKTSLPKETSDFSLSQEADGTVELSIGDTVVVKGETSGECKINDVEYATLVEAVEAAVDGDVITLLRDSEGAGIGLWEANPKSITIDFAGYKYHVIGPAVGSTGTQSQAFHLEKGSRVTLKNGTVDAAPKSESKVAMLIQNYCDLTLDNMVCDCSNNSDITYVCSNNFGSLTVKGNTQIIAANNRVAFDLWFGLNKQGLYDDGLTVTFGSDFTGTVGGKVEYGAQNATRVPEWISRTKLDIYNGTFTGAIVASSNNFTLSDANINVYGGTFESDTWDVFKK